MQKGGLIAILGIFMTNFVSAQYYGGYYGGCSSLAQILDCIGSENVVLAAIFVISFGAIFLALSNFYFTKTLSGEKKVNSMVPIISIGISLLITEFVHINGIDYYGNYLPFLPYFEDFIYSFSSGFLFVFLIGGIIWMLWKQTVMPMVLLGSLFFVLAFFSYNSGGLIGIAIGIWIAAGIVHAIFFRKKGP